MSPGASQSKAQGTTLLSCLLLLRVKLSVEQINNASACPRSVQITPHQPGLDLAGLPYLTPPHNVFRIEGATVLSAGTFFSPAWPLTAAPASQVITPADCLVQSPSLCLCCNPVCSSRSPSVPRLASTMSPLGTCSRQFTVRSSRFAFNCTPFASSWKTLSFCRVVKPQKGRTPHYNKQDAFNKCIPGSPFLLIQTTSASEPSITLSLWPSEIRCP